MVKFMDRFSDFYVKWFFYPIYVIWSLFVFLCAWYLSFDFIVSLGLFMCGVFWDNTFVCFSKRMAEKRSDLERLEDESDGK